MRIKIVGDGLVGSTKVVNAETGEKVEGVVFATWSLDAESGCATSTLVIRGSHIDVDAEAQITKGVTIMPADISLYDKVELTDEQKQAEATIRENFKTIHALIEATVPPGRERSLALTHLQEASHHAIAAISHEWPVG